MSQMKTSFLLLLLTLIFICSPHPLILQGAENSKTEPRHALVIGNGDYSQSPLKNPPNDAKDMSTILVSLDFQVTTLIDADLIGMRKAIRKFGQNLSKGGVGLFYYAGHGMQVKGINYLIPIDADIQAEDEIQDYAVDAGMVLRKMQTAGNRLNIVFLDACRNNPFKRSFRSSQRGLALMDAPSGTMIAYATAPGRTAADGKGRNGIFTKHLLLQLSKPANIELAQLMKRVGKGVQEDTAKQQVPWISSSVTGDFYFRGGQRPTDNMALSSQSKVAEQPSLPRSSIDAEEEFWKAIADSETRQDYLDYLKTYPDGRFRQIALLRLRQLKSQESVSIEGKYRVTGTNPNGSHYSGEAEISKEGDSYTMRWKIANDVFSGQGTLDGTIFTVDWGATSPVIYTISPTGVLEGRWAEGKASEKLTPINQH